MTQSGQRWLKLWCWALQRPKVVVNVSFTHLTFPRLAPNPPSLCKLEHGRSLTNSVQISSRWAARQKGILWICTLTRSQARHHPGNWWGPTSASVACLRSSKRVRGQGLSHISWGSVDKAWRLALSASFRFLPRSFVRWRCRQNLGSATFLLAWTIRDLHLVDQPLRQ